MGEEKAKASHDGVYADESVARIYANGFTLGLTNADMSIVLQLFGRPVAVVSVSYTLAKTLSLKLSHLVNEWEQRTQQTLVTTDKIDELFGTKETP
jgi:hypothetical protein